MRKLLLFAVALLFAGDTFADKGEIRRAGKPVPNQYIVVLEEGAGAPDLPLVASEIARDHGGKLRLVFRNAFQGFSVEMTEERARAMSHDPRVLFVEENSQIELLATQSLPTDNSLWNLDRIDQFDPYLNQQFNYATTGAGVTAYVIDTGVQAAHQEFQTTRNGVTVSRVVRGYDAVPGDGRTPANPCDPANAVLFYAYGCGHGTSVASVLGGATVGVAKAVTIVPIRVSRYTNNTQTGSAEDIIEGIDSGVLPDHTAFPGPAVANMSVAIATTNASASALDLAVNRMIDAGITVFTAAGNQNNVATNLTPPRLARGNGGRVITVGGSMLINNVDSRWVGNNPVGDACQEPGSNYGASVDIFAPAHILRSAHVENATPYRTQCRTGTSFASPMAAGVAAIHLQNATTATPDNVWTTLRDNATTGRLASGTLNGSPDRLLYSSWFTHAPSYEGYLDTATCSSINGWAWDSNQPNSPIDVDVYAGTTWLTTLWANGYRGDLVGVKGNGYHAYGFPAPASIRNGQYHTIRVKYAGTDSNLFSTPKQLICDARIFTTQVPAENLPTGGQVYTVATQFSSTRNGKITQLGFYRAVGETGTNTLRLWTDSGVQLASVTTSCASSGWCWGSISPVSITANTRYRVSVNTNTYQSKTTCGLGAGITNDPLTAHYGYWIAGTAFPTSGGTCNNSNFFLDVKFDM